MMSVEAAHAQAGLAVAEFNASATVDAGLRVRSTKAFNHNKKLKGGVPFGAEGTVVSVDKDGDFK